MLKIVMTIAIWLLSALAQAQSYPTKPVRIVIPFPPGNTTDIMTRLIAPKMSERLGQQVIVENRPGASGMLGLDYVARSPADGYTIACVQGGNMVVLPHTSKSIPYDPLKDFAPIAVSTTNYLAIVADPKAPFKTIGEMVKYATGRAASRILRSSICARWAASPTRTSRTRARLPSPPTSWADRSRPGSTASPA